MFHTLSNVQIAQQKCLRQPIDNRDCNLCIDLRSTAYTVGWYNIDPGETIECVDIGTEWTQNWSISVTPGLYGFKRLKELIVPLDGITLELNKENGLGTLTVARGYIIT